MIISLQEDNASLAQKVAGIEDLFDGKKVEYAALTNRLSELQTQIEGYQARIQKVSIQEAQQKDLLDSLEEKNRKIKEITNEKNALETEKLTLVQTVESLQEAVINHEHSLRRIELLEQEKQELTGHLDEMKEFEQNREMIQKELARRNVEVNTRINEAQQYKNQIAEIEDKLFEIPKLKEEIEKLITSLSTITEQRDKLLQTHEQAAEFTKNYEDLQSKLQEYSNQILESQNQKETDDSTIAEAFERITDLENKLNSERSTQARLHVELRSARDYEEQIARHLGALDEYSSQILELKKQKSLTEQLFAEAQSAMLAAQAAFEVEKSSNWDLSEKYQILSGQLVTAQSELEKQLNRFNSLDEIHKTTDKNYKELKEATELAQIQTSEYLTAKNEAEHQLENEKEQRTAIEATIATLNSELSHSKKEVLELQGEIEKTILTKAEIEEKVIEIQGNYDSLKSTFESLNKELIATKKESDNLHNELEKIALAKADAEEKLREAIEKQTTSEISNDLSGKELIAYKKEITELQSELEKIALAKADTEEKLQEEIDLHKISESKFKEISKELLESKKESKHLQDELEKLALAKVGIEEKILEETELRKTLTKKLEQALEEKSLLTKELHVKVEQEELGSNELLAEITRTKEEVKSLRKKLAIEEEEKTQQDLIIQQYKEAYDAADRIHQYNKSLERERDELTIELSKVRQALYNSNEQMQKNENELLSRIEILNKELAVTQTEDKVLKTLSVKKGKNIPIIEPIVEIPAIEDKKAVVVNKIGDILARLEEALHQPE
ncbi:MAG: hypothetical protein JST20_02260 [Bacteroidetes bacterium]|nr:hypothetical protein [Bacteroidota bacterium]